MSVIGRIPAADVLRQLKEAGLDSMPGTAAEILNDKLRKKICPDILRTTDWIDIIKTAHRLGIATTASPSAICPDPGGPLGRSLPTTFLLYGSL
ncbi:MAG: hypothetical protein Q8R16_04375, partial [bacterium]|nr:hypothetical protein [bacterium]